MRFVKADEQAFAHISRRGGAPKALCGKDPFPARWYVPLEAPTSGVCVTCLSLSGRRKR